MIELERHIEILMLSNDCVIVPGLGGFMAHHVEARYDASDGMFIPPLRTLGFNPQLTMNDSLLVQSYIEAYDISYPEALRRIENEVAELRQHLDTEGVYELNDIGVIRMNDEGKLEFEPCEAGILTPSLYGLSSFELKPYVSTIHARVASITKEKPATEEKESKSLPIDNTNKESDQDDEKAIVIKMSWLRNAAAIAAAIIAFFIIQTPVSNGVMQAPEIQQSSVLPIAQKDTNKLLPSVEEKTSVTAETLEPSDNRMEPSDDSMQPAGNSQQSEPEKETIVAPKATTCYCIVLASQTTRRHADTFVAQLNESGYSEVSIMEMTTGKVRVVYGNFDTDEAANAQLRQLRQQDKVFADAWVLKVQHQE